MNSQNFKRYTAATLGILLSVISCIFTIQTLVNFADTGPSKIVFCLMGIFLQASQAFACSIAAYCFVNKKTGQALPALCAWIFLFCLSLAGTIGSLSRESKQLNDFAKYNSKEYSIIQDKITDIETQIEHTRQVINDCAARSIISKCVMPRQSELKDLLNQKQSLQSELMDYKAQYAGDELYRRIAEFSGMTQDQSKTMMYTLYAIILDLLPAIFLAYSAGLLAFKERDIFAEARIETEKERQRIRAEYERILGSSTQPHTPPQIKEKITPVPVNTQEQRPVRLVEKRQPAFNTFQEDQRYPDQPDYAREAHNENQGAVLSELSMSKPIGFTSNFNTTGSYADIEKHDTCTGTSTSTVQKENPVPVQDTDIERYIKTAFQNMKAGALCGRRKIGDLTGITQKRCDEIHIMLKRAGLIKIQGLKTLPKRSMADMLRAVQE